MKPLNARQKRKVERTLLNKRSYKAIIYGRFFTCLISAMLQLALFAAGVSCYMMLTLVSIRYSCKNFEEIDL